MKRKLIVIGAGLLAVGLIGAGIAYLELRRTTEITDHERSQVFDANIRLGEINVKTQAIPEVAAKQKELNDENKKLLDMLTPEIKKQQEKVTSVNAELQKMTAPMQQAYSQATADRDRIIADITEAHNCKGCTLPLNGTIRHLVTPEESKAETDKAMAEQKKIREASVAKK